MARKSKGPSQWELQRQAWEAARQLDLTHPQCIACRERKPRSDYHADSFSATGLRAQCKQCWNAVRRARAAAAREAAAQATV